MNDDIPPVELLGAQGAQINLSGGGTQINHFYPPSAIPTASSTTAEFREDIVSLLRALDRQSRFDYLPSYLSSGADVARMARTVRVIGRVRRLSEGTGRTEVAEEFGKNSRASRADPDPPPERDYALPSDRDDRADQPPQPWLDVAEEHDRLMLLGDPGMGKSWLVRTETIRLAQVALSALAEPNATVEDVLLPLPIRADVLASQPTTSLPEALSSHMVAQQLLAARSKERLTELIATGGVILLVDALDEVPRQSATPDTSPRRHLEEMLRSWTQSGLRKGRCVFTARLAGYLGAPVPGAYEVELLPFTRDDVAVALDAWELPKTARDRIAHLLEHPGAAAMVRVPLLLALLGSLAVELPDRDPLPTTRTELYQRVIWLFLSGTHRSADPGGQEGTADGSERSRLLGWVTTLALHFADRPTGWVDRMSYQDILSAFDGSDAPASEIFRAITDRAGVLVPAGNPHLNEQSYMFLHRTFAEYLVARRLLDLPSAQRLSVVDEHLWFDPAWEEVIPMLGGLLAASSRARTQAHELVHHLLTRRPDPMNRALHAVIRVLGEAPDPDQVLETRTRYELLGRLRRVLCRPAMFPGLSRALIAAPRWPQHVDDALTERLDHPRASVRTMAIATLGSRQLEPDRLRRIADRLSDPSRDVRQAAIDVLRAHDRPGLLNALTDLQTHIVLGVRLSAFVTLVAEDSRRAIQGLSAPSVESGPTQQMVSADRSLLTGRTRDYSDPPLPSDASFFDDLLSQPSGDPASDSFTQLLQAHPERFIPLLLQRARSASARLRLASVRALADMGEGSAEVTEVLRDTLHDSVSEIREAARESLEQRQPRPTLAELREVAAVGAVTPGHELFAAFMSAVLEARETSEPNTELNDLAIELYRHGWPDDAPNFEALIADDDPQAVFSVLILLICPSAWSARFRDGGLDAETRRLTLRLMDRLHEKDFDAWLETVTLTGLQEDQLVAELVQHYRRSRRFWRRWRPDSSTSYLFTDSIDTLSDVNSLPILSILLREMNALKEDTRSAAREALTGWSDSRILLAAASVPTLRRLLPPEENLYTFVDRIVDRLYLSLNEAEQHRVRGFLGRFTERLLTYKGAWTT